MQTYLRSFLRNIELWLSLVGLAIILLVPATLAPEGVLTFWKIAALTAVGVGLVHGLIFWTVRRRQRRLRNRAIEELREMLTDRVKNQLAVIDMYLPDSGEEARVAQRELEGVHESIDEIAAQVDSISEESLREWKMHYAEAVENATSLERA